MENWAEIYIRPGRSTSFPTGPGSRIDFRGGKAVARDLATVIWALRRADCVVAPAPRHLDFVPDWITACGEHAPAAADVVLPDGTTLHAPYMVVPEQDEAEAEPEAV